MTESFAVRRVREDEWERLKAVRLQAVGDAPMAFGSTLASELGLPEAVWRQRAAGHESRAAFIAERRDEWLGTLTALLHDGERGDQPATVVGMWVRPEARRQGVAGALLAAAAAWVRERGADVLNLHVTETNHAAITLYERLGFRATGETEQLTHTPSLRELHMECPLSEFAWP